MSVFQKVQSETETGRLGRHALWTGVALVGALALTFLFLSVFAAVMHWGNVSEKWIAPVVTVLSLLSLFSAVRFLVHKVGGSFLTGALSGALYYLLLHLVSVLMGADGFSLRALALLVIGALTGGIGANLGKNAPEKKKKHKRKKK